MDFPEVFVSDSGDELDAGRELARRLTELGIRAPFVIASSHGRVLAGCLDPVCESVTPPLRATLRSASQLGRRIHRSEADAVVAIGGGRTLDLAKLAAARAGRVVVTVPTQLSHDGICSPVAVVPDHTGTTQSLAAIAPRAVFIPLPMVAGAPADSLRAGIGDLIANPLALRDWELAIKRGLAEPNPRARELSVRSYELIEPYLDADPGERRDDRAFLRRLADALVHSGLAMICSGDSRPASGAEHEISHALDLYFGSPAMHGHQVAFGCIFSATLHGEDPDAFRARLRRLGLPDSPADLGLTHEDAAELLIKAPDTRPGRFTVLEEADLDLEGARALVERIWGDGGAGRRLGGR